MVAFVIENRRVRFDIDQSAAAKAMLTISSRLMNVARSVGEIGAGVHSMHLFRDMPIKQKLLVIIMSVTAAALLLSGLGIVVADSVLFRGTLQRDISALARIVADNSTAALAFDDPHTATRRWRRSAPDPTWLAACIYRPGGALLPAISAPGPAAGCPAGKCSRSNAIHDARD